MTSVNIDKRSSPLPDKTDFELNDKATALNESTVDSESEEEEKAVKETKDSVKTPDESSIDLESKKDTKDIKEKNDEIQDSHTTTLDESSVDSESKEDKKDMKEKNDEDCVKQERKKEEIKKLENKKETNGKKKKIKEKNIVKLEKNEEDASEKEGSNDDDEEEKEMGLLDRPVEVTGCRARKKVERLDLSFNLKSKEKLSIPEGRGQKLGECPRIETQISKHSAADLKLLHKLLFAKPGSAFETKKNIRKFSGFLFNASSNEYEQRKSILEKQKISALRELCLILDLEKKGNKEDLVPKILQFLLEPKDSGKPLLKKRKSGQQKKKTDEKKEKSKSKESSEEEDVAESASDASDPNVSEEESEHETEQKAKNTKVKKTATKVKTAKKEKPKVVSAKGTKRKRDLPSGSSDEDEPVTKKSKIPDDEDIKKLVKQILENADLQEITMKKVIKQVFDTYPECDLTHKKAFIKKTIKSVIS